MCIKPMEKQWFWGVQMLFWLSYYSCFASSTRVAKKSKTTSGHFLCVVVALTFIFFVSRGLFRFLTFKCPEVGLGFLLFDDTRTLMRPSLDCLWKTFEDDNILRFAETLVQTSEGTQWEQPGLRKELIQPSSSTLFNNSVLLFSFLFRKQHRPHRRSRRPCRPRRIPGYFLCVLSLSWLGCFLCPEVGLGIYF